VFEAHRVADLVDDLLADAVGEDVLVGAASDAAVRGGVQPVGRDDRSLAVEVGEAEHVVAAVIEQVLAGDGDVLVAGPDARGEFDERFGAVLVATPVVRVGGDRLRVVHRDVAVVDGTQTIGGFPLDPSGDVAHRHDVDVHTHPLADRES
jgi:hypothetical protein